MSASTLPAVAVPAAGAGSAGQAGPEDPVGSDDRADDRARMVRTVRRELEITRRETGNEAVAPEVLSAMGRVPRHLFVPERLQSVAYVNRPLPIGHGQTISQPYIVALMTDLLEVGPRDRVLEIGTGSGYQAAVLAELVASVYTVEIVPQLANRAGERLRRLGYDNVHARQGDGYHGWPEHAPFDGIIVTAAASHVPPPLIEQLAPGGTMVIPVGSPFATQQLMLVRKTGDGEIRTRQVLPVAFVPFTREAPRDDGR
ncbi:MAG: protein-L-isoaspartate(D-aspartate) O-methyltransferase [Acidobacteriota bacterium]